MIRFILFTGLLLSASAFAGDLDDAFRNESKVCRKFNRDPERGEGLCKVSNDKQRLLILSPKITTCSSWNDRDLVWVLSEIDVKDETIIRSTKLCNLNMGPLNPPQTDYIVYSFGEMEDGKIWAAYRAKSRYFEDVQNPGKPFQIVKFTPNGDRISKLELIHELESYSYNHPTPYGEYLYKHTPNFTYLESTKEFLFFSQKQPGPGCLVDVNYKYRLCLPRNNDRFISDVFFPGAGNRVIYNFYDSLNGVIDNLRNRAFGVFDFTTGKSIYEYPGEKLGYGEARFFDGSEKYIYFRGITYKYGNPGGTWVAFIIDIESGEIISVPFSYE